MADDTYTLHGTADLVRLDSACHGLLKQFVGWLQQAPHSLPASEAGELTHAADRYLRDFLVDILETGPADADPTLVRRYLANWYIIHTLEPTAREVDRILCALDLLYHFLAERGILDPAGAERVRSQLLDRDYYQRRLETFWELAPDTIAAWRAVDDYRRGPTAAPALAPH